jgi:hypothetical protein
MRCPLFSKANRAAVLGAAFFVTVLGPMGVLSGDWPGVAYARPASEGYYTEAGMGAAAFLGDAAPYSAIGPNLELRVGYDVLSWLSAGLHLGASTHEATVPPPPEGEYYQLYTAAADLRLGWRLDRVALFADGGVGLGAVSSNVLARVGILDPGESVSLTFRAGAGVEYQLQNRHYAVGLAGQWLSMPGFDGTQGVATRLYLRYTY